MKKRFTLVLVLLLGLASVVRASTTEEISDYQKQLEENQARQQELEQKISALQAEERSLQNQIDYMDSQIALTNLKIDEAQTKIAERQIELEDLSLDIEELIARIGRIEESVQYQGEVYGQRVRERYKVSHLSAFEILFGADSLSDVFTRLKYLKMMERQDQRLITQMGDTQLNYKNQKTLLEETRERVEQVKADLEQEKVNLEVYRSDLDHQRRGKAALLTATQNDEHRYQALLAQARAEAAAIRALVSSRGGAGFLSDQTFCNDWGCYYNQRDTQWGALPLGSSVLSVAQYGCLVSSVAMVASHYGFNLTPADIAAESSAFFSPDRETALLYTKIEVMGVRVTRTAVARGYIDSELDAGRPVIVGVYGGPAHFVVIKGRTEGGYVMNDPWYEAAHDIPFGTYYNLGDITRVNKVSVY